MANLHYRESVMEGVAKKVWLTPKGQKKTGLAHIQTTDRKIEVKGPYLVVTGSDTGKIYILDKDDVAQID